MLRLGPTGVCLLAKNVNIKSGAVITPVNDDTVTGMLVTGFPANGVFGYGTDGLRVTRVKATNDGGYGISRFVSSRTLFADDMAIGNDEAGFYVGDSPRPTRWYGTTRPTATSSGYSSGTPGMSSSRTTMSAVTARESSSWTTDNQEARVTPPSSTTAS